MSSPVLNQCQTPEVHAKAWALQPFENDDACGDWLLPLGQNLDFQTANALSASCFVMAGAHCYWKADTPIARAYGFMMCLVGIGSFSFHATSSLVSFMIDIVPMAVTAAMMLFRAVHALQAEAGESRGSNPETQRFVIAMGSSFVAVYLPWILMQLGLSHFKVWGLWAFLFGSMGVAFAIVASLIFVVEGIFWGKGGRDLFISVVAIILGLGCTIHSFIPGLCDGWRTSVPLHAFWHIFSSISANRLGHVLDTLTKLVESMELRECVAKGKRKPLLLRMLKDALPSQFSM